MGHRFRRVRLGLLWTAIVLGTIFLVAGSWALFWTVYNPRVPLAEPRIVSRTPRGDEVTVILGGDFAPADAAMPFIRSHGYRYPYLGTAEILRSADVSFANLESPVTSSKQRFPLPRKYFYRVEPAAIAAWQWLGIDLVSVANNHMRDYRTRGFLDTLRNLDAAGIAHVGGGATETEARRPVIFDVGGTRIGFLGYLKKSPIYNLYLRLFAVGDRPGCAQLNREDVSEDIERLRPLVDLLIVSVHWGKNYAPVDARQEELGRWLADLGVDVVAGHHAHDVQAVETRGKSVILYSLGNYAWGAPGRPDFRIGLLARLRIRPARDGVPAEISSVELIPIATQNRIVRFQPRPIQQSETDWLGPLIDASAALGTKLRVEGARIFVER